MRHAPIDAALFVSHRQQLSALLPPRSVAIVHAADQLPTTGDGTLRIHPAADLFHLTGIEQEESGSLEREDADLSDIAASAHIGAATSRPRPTKSRRRWRCAEFPPL